MKTPEQKARIRAILDAESGKRLEPDWVQFKKQLGDEFGAREIPQLEIAMPKSRRYLWALPAIAALALVTFFLNSREPQTKLKVENAPTATQQTLAKGDQLREGKRTIKIRSGAANLTREASAFYIATDLLAADFVLDEPTDLTIRHPLIKVIVTGTRFAFDADAKGGLISLTQGRLKVEDGKRTIEISAPARYEFGARRSIPAETEDHPFYRYELANGELIFGRQIKVTTNAYEIELASGAKRTISATDVISATKAH